MTGGGLLAVGTGDRSILITALVRSEGDLPLVENFRQASAGAPAGR